MGNEWKSYKGANSLENVLGEKQPSLLYYYIMTIEKNRIINPAYFATTSGIILKSFKVSNSPAY